MDTPSTTTLSPATEKLRKAALAEIGDRIAGKAPKGKAKKAAKGKGKPVKGKAAPKAAKAPKPKREPKARKLGCLGAAAQVITDAPVTAKDLIAKVTEKGLWSSPAGKTPDATLYAAIIREIAAKGKDARFARGKERGTFVKNG